MNEAIATAEPIHVAKVAVDRFWGAKQSGVSAQHLPIRSL